MWEYLSLNMAILPPIPTDTLKAARAVFGENNFYLAVGNKTDQLFEGLILENPSKRFHKSSRIQALLYSITIFQYKETLPDHQAADALRERIEWKYALHLPLNHPGIEAAWFCEFRRWLMIEESGKQNLRTLVSRLAEVTNFTSSGGSSLAPDQIIITVCQFSRLARIWESINLAMEALATNHPNWLLSVSLPHWYERYSDRYRNLNLSGDDREKYATAQAIGADGIYLLQAVSKDNNPALAKLNEIQSLQEIWREQFEWMDDKVSWRKNCCKECSFPGIHVPLSQIIDLE